MICRLINFLVAVAPIIASISFGYMYLNKGKS